MRLILHNLETGTQNDATDEALRLTGDKGITLQTATHYQEIGIVLAILHFGHDRVDSMVISEEIEILNYHNPHKTIQ